MAESAKNLSATVPAGVLEVCKVLQNAGHQAMTVGGAVRDAILGRMPSDWDVATSAAPDAVVKLFSHTIPTGMAHGTVTVMMGRGDKRTPIEVTTFRGEGAYTDARRPDTVVFGVPLREDLARRDFVINAIAYDPISEELEDPFGGLADIEAKRIRAVGRALDRFTEDGLRIMRAVRFCAQLEFDIEDETVQAIAPALHSLEKVSMERVRVELFKLLASPRPTRALKVGWDTGVWRTVLPELRGDLWPSNVQTAAACHPEPTTRLAALLFGLSRDESTKVMRRLTASNAECSRVAALVSGTQSAEEPSAENETRRALARAGRNHAAALIDLWRARGNTSASKWGVEALEANVPLATSELALDGQELMDSLGREPGPWLGECLRELLEKVLEEPSLNDKATLLGLAAMSS